MIVSVIKNRVKIGVMHNNLLTSFLRIIQQRNNDRYLEIASLASGNRVFFLENKSLMLSGRVFYLIDDENGTNGFFAILRKVLTACAISDELGIIPYINIEKSLFNVPGGFGGTDNAFLYYFQNSCMRVIEEDVSKDWIINHENYILFDRRHILLLYKKFDISSNLGGAEYMVNEKYLLYLGSKLKKYVVLKRQIWEELRFEILKILPELENNISLTTNYVMSSKCDLFGDDDVRETDCRVNNGVLAVHYRGSDFNKKLKNHPVVSKYEDYFKGINDALNKGFDKIFLATDDKKALASFVEKYGDKVVYFTDTSRSESDIGTHMMISQRRNNEYYLGREVLRDMITLSLCDGIVGGLSQVCIFSRIHRYAYTDGCDFVFKEIIDHGMYKNDSVADRKKYNEAYGRSRLRC